MHQVSPGEEGDRGRGHGGHGGQGGVQGGEQGRVLTQGGEGAVTSGQGAADTGHCHAGVHWRHVQPVIVDQNLEEVNIYIIFRVIGM